MVQWVNNISYLIIFLYIYITSLYSSHMDDMYCLDSQMCDLRGVVWTGFSGRKPNSPPLVLRSVSRSEILHFSELQPVRGVPLRTEHRTITLRLLSEYTALHWTLWEMLSFFVFLPKKIIGKLNRKICNYWCFKIDCCWLFYLDENITLFSWYGVWCCVSRSADR